MANGYKFLLPLNIALAAVVAALVWAGWWPHSQPNRRHNRCQMPLTHGMIPGGLCISYTLHRRPGSKQVGGAEPLLPHRY